MPLYLLDGNILTELEDRRKPLHRRILARLIALEPEDRVALSIISACEFQHGIAKATSPLREALEKSWQTFEETFEILPLTLEAAKIYGRLRADYENLAGNAGAGNRHTADFLMASTALDSGAVLVSSDRIFGTLTTLAPQLIIEDWREQD